MLRNGPSHLPAVSPSQTPPSALQPLPASVCSLRDRTPDYQPDGHYPPSGPSSTNGGDESAFEDILLRPLPSALTHTLTHYDPAASSSSDDFGTPRPFSHHQRSLTDTLFDKCSPLVQRATSALQQSSKVSLHSPKRSLANFISPSSRSLSRDYHSSPTKTRASKALGEWFSGASVPINVGLAPSHLRNIDPTDDEAEDDEAEEEMFTQSQKSRDAQRLASAPATGSGKFSWILGASTTSLMSLGYNKDNKSKSEKRQFEDSGDDLLSLRVESALFPSGPADPLSPNAFNDLLAAAESLLQRYQTAYRQQHLLIAELSAEQSAQDDELDGAETRARHLKLQLDDMAEKAAEQNREMHKLHMELEAERRLRKQEEEAYAQVLRGLDRSQTRVDSVLSRPMSPTARVHSKRLSTTQSIDSGFESGDESCTSANPSQMTSPTLLLNESMTQSPADSEQQETSASLNSRPPKIRNPSLYDRVAGSRGNGVADPRPKSTTGPKEDLSGLGPWQVVSNMREENAHLRVRIRELESAVEDSLDLMVGISLR